MTRPTVVVLCPHGEAKPHPLLSKSLFGGGRVCLGGRVLNQAIIIERDTDGNWPEWAVKSVVSVSEWQASGDYKAMGYLIKQYGKETLDALASAQEGK